MLSLILSLVLSQQYYEKEINIPFVKKEVVNSANNCFKTECLDYWVKNWKPIPVYLLIGDKEEIVGTAVCAHIQNDWIVAKIELKQPIPRTYVCRPHSKPVKVEVTDGCFFNIYRAELVRLLIVNPLHSSKYPEENQNKILIGN
jgi:hypothetical protein